MTLYDLLATTLIVRFPCCLLFLQGLSACDFMSKQYLFSFFSVLFLDLIDSNALIEDMEFL